MRALELIAEAPGRVARRDGRTIDQESDDLTTFCVRPARQLVALGLHAGRESLDRRIDVLGDGPRRHIEHLAQLIVVGREPEGDLHPAPERQILAHPERAEREVRDASADEVAREVECVGAQVRSDRCPRIAHVGGGPVEHHRARVVPRGLRERRVHREDRVGRERLGIGLFQPLWRRPQRELGSLPDQLANALRRECLRTRRRRGVVVHAAQSIAIDGASCTLSRRTADGTEEQMSPAPRWRDVSSTSDGLPSKAAPPDAFAEQLCSALAEERTRSS